MRILQQLLLFMCLAFLPTQGWAATAHVTNNVTRDNTGTNVGTVAVTLTGVGSGNAIACGVAWANQSITLTSVSDGTTNFTISNNNTNAGALSRMAMARLPNSSGGSVTLTATYSGSFTESKIIACASASGTDAADLLDAATVVDIGAVGAGTDSIAQAVTITTSGTYIFAMILDYSQNGAVSAGTNYTTADQFSNNTGASIYRANYAGTGSTNVNATTGAFDTHAIGILVFKPAAGAAASAPSLMLMGVGR